MNIDEEFARFIEFPEGSSGLYVTTVSAKLFAEHCIEQLEQDRDQLKAEVEALKPYKDNHIDLMNHINQHDADVIDAAIADAEQKLGMICHEYRCAKLLRHIREYANQLRQKAQVTK